MQDISDFYYRHKNFLKKNKIYIYIVSAILCCLFVVAVLAAFMPKVKAEEGDSFSNPINVSSGNIIVEKGKYYRIYGNYSLSNTYVFEYTGEESTGSVNIILYYANITMTEDIPAIEFKAKNGITFNLILSGESSIKGIDGAFEPLIKVENYNIPIYTVDKEENTKLKTDYIKNNVKVNVTEGDSNGGSLYLETGENSYGAAIGTSEIQHMIDSRVSNLSVGSGENISVEINENTIIAKNGEQLINSDNELEIGSSPVSILKGLIEIVGNGYGAGIGNGGQESFDLHIKKNNGNLIISNIKGSKQTYIKDGTVSVIMSLNSKGSCFENGAVYGGDAAQDGIVAMDGGSLYISRQGVDASEKVYDNIINSKGQRLYLYIANYIEDNDHLIVFNSKLLNANGCKTEYTYSTKETNYNPDIMRITKVKAVVDLEGGQYIANSHAYNNAQDGKFYFYLPSVLLNRHSFIVQNDGRTDIVYSYSVSDDPSDNIDTMTFQTISEEVEITVKQDEIIFIKLAEVPSYIENIELSYTTTDEEVISVGNAVVNKSADGSYYYAYIEIGDSDVGCIFTYQIGTFNISYDLGLLAPDAIKASSIINTNTVTADCGTQVTLSEPTWDNKHHFKGWYDKITNQQVTALFSTSLNETLEVYAKWECNVTYTNDGNVVGVPYVIEYGSYITNSLHPTSPNDTELIKFIGWNIKDNVYNPKETFSYQITEDLIIKAELEKIGYYVYLTAVYIDADGNQRQCDIKEYSNFGMVYEDKLSVSFSDINDELYYKTIGFANGISQTTATIAPKKGYSIYCKSVDDSVGNPIEIISSDEDINAFLFTMPQTDIYITIYIKAQSYSISYYDVNEKGNEIRVLADTKLNNNPEFYTIESEVIKLNELKTRDNKCWNFKGWYEWGTSKDNVITNINPEDLTRNLVLMAIWEEVSTYDAIEEDTTITKSYDGSMDEKKSDKVFEDETTTIRKNSYISQNGGIRTGDEGRNKVVYLIFTCILTFMLVFAMNKRKRD